MSEILRPHDFDVANAIGAAIAAVSGSADTGRGRAVSADTPFALASVSKPFTAAVALLLDACGLMPLTTRARSLVPYADVREEATIEDLLRHEAGMSDWLTDKYTRMDWLIAHPNGKVGPKTAVQNLLPRGEIGMFEYSNSSLTLPKGVYCQNWAILISPFRIFSRRGP